MDEKIVDQVNEFLENELANVDHLKGMEILLESLSNKIADIFGRNALLSMLYQIGATTGAVVAKRIMEEQGKDSFTVIEAFSLLFRSLKQYFRVMVKHIEQDGDTVTITFTNHCFLRTAINDRPDLRAGGRLCRITKGYIESALSTLLKDTYQKIDVGFLENDEENDCCLERVVVVTKHRT